jgi:hypothetical protein
MSVSHGNNKPEFRDEKKLKAVLILDLLVTILQIL